MAEPPADVSIAPADTGDVDRLTALWVELADSQRRHGSHLRPTENEVPIRETMHRHAVADTALLARRGDEIVGFVTFDLESGRYRQDRTRGLIHNVYVTPPHRSAGIGRALIEAAEAALSEAGADVVAIGAMADNDAAVSLYRRLGYAPHRLELEKPINDDDHGTDEG